MDDDAKHALIDRIDEQAEGEPSEEVVSIDDELEKVGLRPDPDGTLKELNSQQDLTEDEKAE